MDVHIRKSNKYFTRYIMENGTICIGFKTPHINKLMFAYNSLYYFRSLLCILPKIVDGKIPFSHVKCSLPLSFIVNNIFCCPNCFPYINFFPSPPKKKRLFYIRNLSLLLVFSRNHTTVLRHNSLAFRLGTCMRALRGQLVRSQNAANTPAVESYDPYNANKEQRHIVFDAVLPLLNIE